MTGPRPAGRPWTGSEDGQLRDMLETGMTAREIARKLKRTPTAVLMVSSGSVCAGPHEDARAAAERGDFATVLRLWHPLAEQGNSNSQYNLGAMYSQGQGVPQDYNEAAKWFRLTSIQ